MSALQQLGINNEQLIKNEGEYSETQTQTENTFYFKWAKRETYESEIVKETSRKWLLERYCENDPKKLETWLSGEPKIILDAGCGSGFSAIILFGDHLKDHHYLGVDISKATEVARTRFQEMGYPGDFLQADLMNLPVPDQSIDIIFSEGVLHHTDNTEKAIKYLTQKLKKDGLFMFYVYAKKAVVREFTDDYIRDQLKEMTNEQAWEVLKPLTKLGIALGELNQEIDIPEDIPFLGIKKGKIDIQRFFYWNICKIFYREDFELEELNHINFDWFRPMNCHRHTPEEINLFCQEANLLIEHINVQESGITVVAKKQ